MKRSKSKINVGFKKVLASFLTITMLGFQANIMAFASNITGVTGNNGVYNINPSKTSGSTGFRHYTDFTLDNGHTANLIFEGINRFVNAVDNQVTINGILNSVNGSGVFANGRAIFISPKGFVVGSSGVVNVGSLGVYTPSASAYNSFKNLSVDKMTDALLNGDAYYGNGAITISGMILTRESLDLKGGTVKINDTAKIASGILDKNTNAIVAQNEIARASSATNARNNATTLFNKLVNSGKANFASDEFNFASNNGNITIAAKGNLDVNGTTVANGKYVLKQTGEGNLNTSGTSIANGDVSIIKNGAGSVNVGGTLTNAKGGAKTYIGNESASGGDLSVTGDVKTNGDTMIVQGGSGLLNISKTLNSGSTTISSVNGSGINVADVNSSGNVVIENGARGSINVGSINAASVSIQNQNYKITANRAEGNDSGFITLKREDSDALAKDGGIVTNGDISVNNILIQNSGSKGIETNGNIGKYGTRDIKIITDNGGINLKSGGIYGNAITITGANNATGNIQVDANVVSYATKIENAGKGDIIINGNISNDSSAILIENQTYDIVANRATSGDYKVLDVKRYDRDSKNLNGGIFINGQILANNSSNVYIQNAGAKGITTTNDITGRNIYITNKGGSINLNSGEISSLLDTYVQNLSDADGINIGANIKANSDSSFLVSKIKIENLGKEDINISGDLFAADDILINNQVGWLDKGRVVYDGGNGNVGLILNPEANNKGTSANKNADSGINISGNIQSRDSYIRIGNLGKNGIKTSGDITATKQISVVNDNGNINITGGTINGSTVAITNANKGGSLTSTADINASDLVLIENAGNGDMTVGGDITSSKVLLENQTYDIVTSVNGNCTNYLDMVRRDAPSANTNGGLIANGNIYGNNILIQNAGSKGIETNGNIGQYAKTKDIKIVTDNGGINLKSGKIYGNAITITGANNATGDIKVDTNVNGNIRIENAGKGDIIVNGNLNNSDSSHYVVIENQTYDIVANRASDGDYKVLDVKRYNRNSQNLNGGILANGKIFGNEIYIQNAGAKGITTTNDITGRNIYITNDGGSIDLISGKISSLRDITISNLSQADGINIGADINANSNNSTLSSIVYIANAGKGDLNISGDIFAQTDVMITNQLGTLGTTRVTYDDGFVLNMDYSHGPSVNLDENTGINISGNINANRLVTIQNAGKKGITMDSNVRAGEFVENESGEMVNEGVISVINDGGNINITGGTLEAPTVSITNTNKGGSLTTKANINASKIALIENAGNGDMTVGGDITGGKILLENQTYDIVAEVAGECNNALTISRLDAPSSNTNGGLIASGNILGETVYVQNSGVNGITSNANVTSQGNVMITNNNGDINLVSGDVAGNNVTITNSNQAGSLTTNANINASGIALIENAGKGDMTVGGNVQGSIVSLQNQTYDIETPRKVIKNEHAEDDNSENDNNNNLIILEVKRSDKDSANKDGGLVVNGSVYGDSAFIQNAGKGGITTNNSSIIASDVIITNDNGSVNINDGMIYGNDVIISNSNKGNKLNVSADIEALNAALIENAGNGDMTVGGSVQGPLVSLQNQTYDIEAPRYVAESNDLIILNLIRKDAPSANKNGGLTVSGNINGGQVYIQNAGAKGITTSGDITGASSVNITNDAGNINLASGTINSSQVVVSNSNQAGSLTTNANINASGITLIENAGNGDMTVGGNVQGSIVSLQNQTYDIVTPRLSGNDLILLDVNRVDAPSSNTNGGLILNGNVAGSLVYIQNSGANGITSNSSISSLSDVMITNNNGNVNLVSGDIFGENVIVSNSNKAGSLTANSNINASNLALIENAGNGDMTVGGNVQGALVSLQNQTYDIETPRYVTQSNGLITLGVTRKDAPSKNRENALVTSGTLSGDDVYVQNSGKGGIKSNSDIQAQNDVMITNNGGSINLESGNISGKNVIVSNSNQATGGILVGANINSQKTGKLVVENAAPGSIILNGNLNGNGGYVIIENQTYDIETPRVVYGDFIVLDVNRINKPSQNVDGGIIANGTISGGDVFIQNVGSQGITINNDIISDNLMVTNDNGGINIGNVNITALNRNVLISNSSNATEGVKIAANVIAEKGDVVVENSGNGNIELKDTSSLAGKRVLVENQTYDITTPRVPEGNYILLGVERNKIASPNNNSGIIANGKITAEDIAYIQNSGKKGISGNGNIKGSDIAITNNGGAINLSSGDIEGNKVIISQSNQGEGGVTIGANVKGTDRIVIENAGKGDITIGGNVNGKKVSIQNQTYDIVTPRNTDDNPYISLDVTRIDQDSPNKDGGIKIDGNVTGTEDNKIQNSGEKGITSNGEVKGGNVDITNNGGDVNINGKVDGNDVTISNSDNGGDVNINGKVGGNDVLVENNGSGNINNPQNVNGNVKDHEYTIDTPRNTDDNPYISLDVKRGTPFPKPIPEPTPTPVIRDNDPTRLIYDKKRDDSFLELKRESIRYGINGDSLSLNSASNHIQGIVDISKTGLAVKTDGSLKINDEVKVNFAYKGIEVEATAKVMRVNQANNIAGLKFTDLDALTANKILYLSMLIEAQKEQTASNNQNQQPSFMNVLSKL